MEISYYFGFKKLLLLLQKNYFMKKLIFISVLFVFVGCEKYNIQKDCERQATEYLKSLFSSDVEISDIKFSKLYEINLPIDSFYTYQNYIYYQNLLDKYVELYGDDTSQSIYDEQMNIEQHYVILIYLLEHFQSVFIEFEKKYTSKNYALDCDFLFVFNNEKTPSKFTFYFNEYYKLIP